MTVKAKVKREKDEKDNHVRLVLQDSSHVERRPHLWCNRCDERMVLIFPLNVSTMVEVSKGFARAHKECRSRPLATVPSRPPITKPEDWLRYGEVGVSSKVIWKVMAGSVGPIDRGHTPSDPGDFRRCHLLLECFPDWRAMMSKVAAFDPAWGPLVREWDRLTALYVEELPIGHAPKLYEAMKALEAEARSAQRAEAPKREAPSP